MAELTRKTWPRYVFIILAVLLIGFFVFYHFRPTSSPSTPSTPTTTTTATSPEAQNEQHPLQQVATSTANDTRTSLAPSDGPSSSSSPPSSASTASQTPQVANEPAQSPPAVDFTQPAIHKDENERPAELSTNEMSPPAEQIKQVVNEAPITPIDLQPLAASPSSSSSPPLPSESPSPASRQNPTNELPKEQSTLMNVLNNQQVPLPPPGQQQVPDVSPVELDKWQEFKRQYNRQYPSQQEELKRQAIFFANWRFIRSFNERSQASYTLDINHFADFTRDEINQIFIGPQLDWNQTINMQTSSPPMKILDLEDTLESSGGAASAGIDWRNLTGAPVDQATCKESSVFAIVASLESTLNAALSDKQPGQRQLVKFSEQQLLDCLAYNAPPPPEIWPPICQGHLSMVNVFELLQRQSIRFVSVGEYMEFKRLQAAHLAPPNTCQLPPSVPEKPRLGSYVQVHKDNMQEAVMNSGPLVVALDASQPTFHFYKSGLYHELACSVDSYNLHALLVAYSPGTNGDPSYTIRASFGQQWGEAGFMRLLKDETRNKCLPQHLAIYPNIALSQ